MAEAGTLPSPRLAFPMGRVYHKLGRYEDAIAVYMKYENAGYGPILSNLGVIYEDGTGQPANLDLAFDYFRRAGQAGLLNGWLNALALLDRPDAPASVKPNLAEVLRQVVATSGDANAAYRLAEAIASGQIAPASPDERTRMLETSLDGGKLDGAVTLIRLQEESEGHVAAFLTAEKALNMAQSASLDQDAGWPPFQPSIALEIVRLGTEHSDFAPLQKAAAELDAQYGDKLYTLSIRGTTCAGTATPLSFFYWDEAGRDTSPIDSQIAYYKLRECDAPSESIKEINDIFVNSKADGTSFVAMLNAFVESTQEEPDNPEAAPAQRKLSEVFAVFEKGSDGTYWVNPAPGQAVTGEGIVKLSASLTCEEKEASAEFSVFRNPAQRVVPDFQARVVSTLLAGTSCDLETNAGVVIDSIAGPLRKSEDFADDMYVSILFYQSVVERWLSGRVPLVYSLSTACKQTIVDGMVGFADYERVSESEIEYFLTTLGASEAIIDDKSLHLDPILVSGDDKLSFAVLLWDYGNLLARCASGTYFWGNTMFLGSPLDPGFSEVNVLAFAVDLGTERVEIAGARLVMEDVDLQTGAGIEMFGDWSFSFEGGQYTAFTENGGPQSSTLLKNPTLDG